MAICTITSASQLQSSFIRLDAEYFKPEYTEAARRLNSIPGIIRLGRAADRITQGSNPRFSNRGLPCVNGKNIAFGTMFKGEPNYVSAKEFERLSGYLLRRNDLVITLKHATKVGRAWIVEDDELRIFSRNVGLLRLRSDSRIRHSVLLLYLWTKAGQLLIDRSATGGTTGQITLPMSELRRLPIPPISDNEQDGIETLFLQSRSSAGAAISQYESVRGLLDAELGLDKLMFRKPVGYTTRFSDIEVSRRIDAEHYFPEFLAFKAGLRNGISLSPLSNDLEFCGRGQQPTYAKTGLLVINSKHVQPNRVIMDGNRLARANPDPNLQIRFGDTLLNGTGRGTIGRSAPYLAEGMAVADNHVTILRSRSLDSAFLSLYLNSRAGQMQVEMHQRGTSGQLELYPLDIRKFLVWVAPKEFQQEIRRLHDKAPSAERESTELLKQAKSRVEQLIEEAVQP